VWSGVFNDSIVPLPAKTPIKRAAKRWPMLNAVTFENSNTEIRLLHFWIFYSCVFPQIFLQDNNQSTNDTKLDYQPTSMPDLKQYHSQICAIRFN